jgi:hypothetical protein
MYRLRADLEKRGFKAYIPAWQGVNSDYPTAQVVDKDWVIVYPEIIKYPLPIKEGKQVVWMMFYPGRNGGEKEYNQGELIFTWSKNFGDWPQLKMPTVDKNMFYNKGLTRTTEIWYFKGKNPQIDWSKVPNEAREITYNYPAEQEQLVKILNTAKELIVFDHTALSLEAEACGCKVIRIHDTIHFTYDELDQTEEEYQKQLDEFIKITQL